MRHVTHFYSQMMSICSKCQSSVKYDQYNFIFFFSNVSSIFLHIISNIDADLVYVLSENRRRMMKIRETMSQLICTTITRGELVNSSRIPRRASTPISRTYSRTHSIITPTFRADATRCIKMRRLSATITCSRATQTAIPPTSA